MTNQEKFTAAYLEAMDFTELGEDTQPPRGAELTELSKAQALKACSRFYNTYKVEIGEHIEQAGHDFWLTRQHHGAGFWDRPEIYGEEVASQLAQACHAIGEVFEVDYGERDFGQLPKGAKFMIEDRTTWVKIGKGWATYAGQERLFKSTHQVWVLSA